MSDPDQNNPLYNKFRVERHDGSSEPGGKHENCDFYVLDLVHDKFAVPALAEYLYRCADEYPLLALNLLVRIREHLKDDDTYSVQGLFDHIHFHLQQGQVELDEDAKRALYENRWELYD